MKRFAMLRWLGTGALGMSLVAGCSHNRSTTVRNGSSTPVACANCGCPNGQCQGTVAAANPQAPAPQARTVPMYTSAASVPAPSYGTIPRTPVNSGVIQTSATETQSTQVQSAAPEVQPGTLKSPFTRGEPAPTRKSYVDITASPSFSHSADYGVICGQVEQCCSTHTWKLRYLSVDESDAHGGSVTLTGDSAQLSALKDGQCVKVQGHLCTSDQKGTAPAYRIELIEPLNSGN